MSRLAEPGDRVRFDRVMMIVVIGIALWLHVRSERRFDPGLLFLGCAGVVLLLRSIRRTPAAREAWLDLVLRLSLLSVSLVALIVVDIDRVSLQAMIPFALVIGLVLVVSEIAGRRGEELPPARTSESTE